MVVDIMSFNSFALLASSCIAMVGYVMYDYYTNVIPYWSKKGLRGPTPLPIIGNVLRLMFCNRMELELDWVRRYGKLYGTHRGVMPHLVVADPEVLRQICIKDFDHFQNHDMGDYMNEYQKNFIIALQGDHWKRVRALLSPTFTSSKMRRMFCSMELCGDMLIETIKETFEPGSSCQVADMKQLYQTFTMDTIAACCFGLKLKHPAIYGSKKTGPREEFIKASEKVLHFSTMRIMLYLGFPRWLLRAFGFKIVPMKGYKDLLAISDRVIASRRESGNKPDDLLQSLIDAKLDTELELDDFDVIENHHASLTNSEMVEDRQSMSKGSSKSRSLNDIEIMASTMFFLVVGLETTGTLLTHCTYALAFHPEIQNRLYEEVKKIAKIRPKDNDKNSAADYHFDYESLTTCEYLDAVISESLRILPPIVQGDRVCNRDYRFENSKLDILCGMRILPAFYAIMNDPDYWHEPQAFNPDRFMPENRDKIVPGSYCPFGLGPRYCLGMRFALMEAKLALSKMVMMYRFEPAPGTRFPPTPKLTLFLNIIRKPLVKLVTRGD